jgi:hypothetical protein
MMPSRIVRGLAARAAKELKWTEKKGEVQDYAALVADSIIGAGRFGALVFLRSREESGRPGRT